MNAADYYLFGGAATIGYVFLVMLVHSIAIRIHDFEDEFNAWLFCSFWPIMGVGAVLWLATHRWPSVIAAKISVWRTSRINKAEELYDTVRIPKENISDLNEYRRLGEAVMLIQYKLTSYETANKVPIEERMM